MFKLTIYCKRMLNTIPPFVGLARRVERLSAIFETTEAVSNNNCTQTISGGHWTAPHANRVKRVLAGFFCRCTNKTFRLIS